MDAVTATFIITIIELAIKYGVPTVMEVIRTWDGDTESITEDDIQRLRDLVKRPDEYFEKGGEE